VAFCRTAQTGDCSDGSALVSALPTTLAWRVSLDKAAETNAAWHQTDWGVGEPGAAHIAVCYSGSGSTNSGTDYAVVTNIVTNFCTDPPMLEYYLTGAGDGTYESTNLTVYQHPWANAAVSNDAIVLKWSFQWPP